MAFHISVGITVQRNGAYLPKNGYRSCVLLADMCWIKLQITRIRDDGYVEFDILDGEWEGWGCICHHIYINRIFFIND